MPGIYKSDPHKAFAEELPQTISRRALTSLTATEYAHSSNQFCGAIRTRSALYISK